ncbi:hypothetical protein HMPREF1022_02446 [Desulfovibrio sp. 6_1_46AFAA]|uniref:alcohol dehydrogenase catalytic domain-containing protein n=1 Tax=Desulfovibrio sp. 6_1_46AFAA TaxID=665942 RepID=UPI0002236F88|nr:alcohol dehydrogenase catalytic domain-containing protein [Desulfovibrio sp. 6_1_46AFAA]EGW50487.1 hypothetical protein HMPREF1022_02446 [Desulfovibrio sp. 6_1_46AFAA]
MMKALVYTQPHEMQCRDYPEPTLEPGEVIIEIKASGICGSDMHAYHGHDPRRQPGLVMGHELSGEIHASASPRFKAGQKVTVDPLITCGCCSYCRTGRDNLCENRGMVGMSRPGAYAEFMSIPTSSVIPVPDDMPHTMAVLTEPAATVLHALNISLPKMARPVQECKVLVIGGGAIGLLMALLLRSRGVHHVDLAETNPLRLASAGEHSKARAFDPMAEPPAESFYEYVVDAVGRKVTREMAVHALKPGGVLMHMGLQDWSSQMDMRKITLAEHVVLGTYTYTYADLQATVEALRNNVFGNLAWVEYRSLADGPEAFRVLDQRKTQAAKIVLLP